MHNAYEIQILNKNLKMKSNSSANDIPSKFSKIASCIVPEWLSNFFNKYMYLCSVAQSRVLHRVG